MKLTKLILLIIFGQFFIHCSAVFSQSIVWEKVYDMEELYSSAFNTIVFPSFEHPYFYGIGTRLRLGTNYNYDTNYIVIAKIDNDGNLIFVRQYYKIVGGKLKRIFFKGAKVEKIGDKEFIVVVSFLPIFGSSEFFLGFWLYVMKFDNETGDLLFEGLDTLSKHTMTPIPGPLFELNNLYYNFSSYKKDTILLKVFGLDGNFVSESRIILNNLPPDEYRISFLFLKKTDSSYILVLQNTAPWFLDVSRSYLLKINKDFTLEWLKPLVIDKDTLRILSILGEKNQKIIALCTKLDTTRYFVEIESDGSISNVKEFKIDKRFQLGSFTQISDGGFILLAQFRLTPIFKPDTSIGVFAKLNKNYEFEQVFYHKREPMPWGHLFNGVYELPDHTFLVRGYYNYYPYIIKLSDVLVGVEEEEKTRTDSNWQVVDDYIYLSDVLEPQEVSVYSLEGIKVFESNVQGNIYVKHLPSGIYFLKIGAKIYKFVKL